MPTLPTTHWDHITTYLAASRHPVDLTALHAVSAPDALLVIGNFLKMQQEIEPDRYAQMAGQLLGFLPPDALGPTFEPLEALDWQPDAEGGCALVRLRELGTGTVVTAGFRLEGATGLVYGACLHDAPLPAPEVLRARILAELAHWAPQDGFPVWPLTGLALSFYRLHTPVDKPFAVLPESRFTCQGRGHCCLAGSWRISTNQNAQRALLQVRWDQLDQPGPAFAPMAMDKPNYRRDSVFLEAHDDDRCKTLNGKACSIHAVVGWQPLDPCMQFPFMFVVTPDAITVTASHTCGTVAENQGRPFAEQGDDLRQRFQPRIMQARILGDAVPLTPDGPPLTWPAYRWLEERLLDILADDRQPIVDRLRAGSRHLAGVLATPASPGDTLDVADVAALWEAPVDLPATSPSLANSLAALCFSPVPTAADDEALLGGSLAAWQETAGKTPGEAPDDAMLTRYLRTVLFRKHGAEYGGLAYAWGILPWLYQLWLRDSRHRSRVDGRPIDHDLQVGTVRRLELWHFHNSKRYETMLPHGPFSERLVKPELWSSLLQ